MFSPPHNEKIPNKVGKMVEDEDYELITEGRDATFSEGFESLLSDSERSGQEFAGPLENGEWPLEEGEMFLGNWHDWLPEEGESNELPLEEGEMFLGCWCD
jgi:hypothetical protein